MSIYNEYNNLKTVFVGKLIPSKIWKKLKIRTNKTVDRINDETNEDLDKIHEFLESQGVKVYRPNTDLAPELFEKYGHISNPGAVRDWLFSYGDKLLVCNTSFTDRINEHEFWREAFDDLRKKGKTISFMPRENIDKDWPKITEKLTKFWSPNFNFSKWYPPNDGGHKTDIPELQEWQKHLDATALRPSTQEDMSANVGYMIYGILNKYHFFHAASCFRHNDTIVSTPMGTTKGFAWFKKEIEEVNPNVKWHIHNFCSHIDGGTIILTENKAVSIHQKLEPFNVIHLDKSFTSKEYLNSDFDKNLERVREVLGRFGQKKMNEALRYYYENLTGYDQRVDFDINGITYEPNKFIATVFNKKVIDFLETKNITVKNIPLRHREVISGGIHCMTCDIDREAN